MRTGSGKTRPTSRSISAASKQVSVHHVTGPWAMPLFHARADQWAFPPSRDAAADGRYDGRHFPVETWFCRGAAAEEIVRVAREIGCDLIVMGTHGRTGLERLLMGNTAESVVPEADCPVMIVKAPQDVPSTTSNRPGDKKMTIVF